MLYKPLLAFVLTQKAGNWKILVVSSLLIDGRAVIIPNKVGTIGFAAYWTAIAEVVAKIREIKYLKNILIYLTFILDFFVILA